MNFKMILSTVGKMLVVLSLLLILPMLVAIIYKEKTLLPLLISAVGSFVVGAVLYCIFKTKNHVIYAKEGFAIVALVWLLFSAVGAVPFVLSGEIPSYVDAFFETVSGFTTTGASILVNVEEMSHSLLFWRSFTHWVGGMGVLVFVMALIPNLSDRSIHLLRAEVPGPIVGKVVPRIKDSSRILYIIYMVLTLIEIIMLLFGGMPLFDSVVHAFGTAGTGGFGTKLDSIGGYNNYLQWVIAVFMLIFGVNFNIYYMVLSKKAKSAFKSEEFWTYIGIVLVSTAIICANIYPRFENIGESLRHAFFQVSSIMTTTGYATQDFNLWPSLSKSVLLLLMFIGACAGSTAGGLKVSRIVMMFKNIRREIKQMIHPRSVSTVKFEDKRLEEKTISSVGTYLAVYLMCFAIIFLLISFEPFSIETNFSAAASCFNNIGPGLDAVGPAANYAEYSNFSKIILSIAMLLGRLEIYPMLIFLMPSLWKKD